jgi:hypothetical protein
MVKEKEDNKTFDYTSKNKRYLRVEFEDGSHQNIHPSVAFDGNWKALASQIAEGRPYTFKLM